MKIGRFDTPIEDYMKEVRTIKDFVIPKPLKETFLPDGEKRIGASYILPSKEKLL